MTDSRLPCINLKTLMADRKKIILEHNEKHYLLSITRRGKLILTAANSDNSSDSTPDVA